MHSKASPEEKIPITHIHKIKRPNSVYYSRLDGLCILVFVLASIMLICFQNELILNAVRDEESVRNVRCTSLIDF